MKYFHTPDLHNWLDELGELRASLSAAVRAAERAVVDYASAFMTPQELAARMERVMLAATKDLVADIARLSAKRPEAIAAHPFASMILYDVLQHVANDRDPVMRLALVGPQGAGKTTLAFWLLALLYGFSRGLCKGKLGRYALGDAVKTEIRGKEIEVPRLVLEEPPDIDCNLGVGEKEPPGKWKFIFDVVLSDAIENIVEKLRITNKRLREGEPVEHWAFLIDEAGAVFGAALYHLDRRRYAVNSIVSQLARTYLPFAVTTAVDVEHIASPVRKMLTDTAFIYPCRYGRCQSVARGEEHMYAVLRLVSAVPPFGPADKMRTRVAIGRAYLATYPALRLPRWFYVRHLAMREALVEQALSALEGGGKGGRRKKTDWDAVIAQLRPGAAGVIDKGDFVYVRKEFLKSLGVEAKLKELAEELQRRGFAVEYGDFAVRVKDKVYSSNMIKIPRAEWERITQKPAQ